MTKTTGIGTSRGEYVKVTTSDLGNLKLIALNGPDEWAYEGSEPHYYVLEKEGKFYAFQEDKDHYDMIECLMNFDLDIFENLARFTSPTLEGLVNLISDYNAE